MNGPGIVPPPPNDGARTGLRVLFVLLGVMSCGMLAWVPLLRVALLRRRNAVDWVLCGASFVLTVVLVALLGGGDDNGDNNSPRDNAVVSILVIQAVAAAVYYLVSDIRHFREADALAASRGYAPQGRPQFPYGAAQARPPHQAQHPHQTQLPPARTDYNPYRDTPTPAPAQPPTPVPAPTPAPVPAPDAAATPAPRIERVRAELDELSDYLRKEEGR